MIQTTDVEKYEGFMYEKNIDESYQTSFRDKAMTARMKQYLCCGEVWKGLGLMFFYQFAGYNVVSFYATSILNRPKETEEELMHPNRTNNFVAPLDDLIINKE